MAAQKNAGKISAVVVDSLSNTPLAYVTGTLINTQTSKTISGAITDSLGHMDITSIPSGSFILVLETVGYNRLRLNDITINKQNTGINLGLVRLQQSASSLDNVVVTSVRPIVVNTVDKIVYNVANDVTSQGGVALDVLKKVPQVNVDVDGNVELQGNSNIRFLINGKPSSVFGNSLTDALSSIPASNIKSIEAITTPGAKYDAQGTGGIINIVLKDSRARGINGTVNLSAGSRLENGSFNINYHYDNISFNAFFNGNAQLRSKTPFIQNRTSWDTATQQTTKLVQNGYNDFVRNGLQTGLGLDWDWTKKDNISASFAWNHFYSKNTGVTSIEQNILDVNNNTLNTENSLRNGLSKNNISSYEWSLGYTHKMKKDGASLSVLYNASYGTPNSYAELSQYYIGQTYPYMGSVNNNPGQDHQNYVAVDYTNPISFNFTLETGLKGSWQNITSNTAIQTYKPSANAYFDDPTQSYQMRYQMNVYAAYVSGSFNIGHFLDVKAGGRYEYTHVNIDYPNTHVPSYGTFVPSIILSHKLDEMQLVKLAYTRRLERPEYKDLNPYLNISDPYNITTGNPLLVPEKGNNIELGYARNFNGGGNLYVAALERINTSDVKPYTTFYPTYTIGDSVYDNVSVSNRMNVGTEYNSGAIITSSIFLGKFNIRENAMLINKTMINNLNHTTTNSFTWRLNANLSYQWPSDFVAEIFGDYRSAFTAIQGKVPQQLTYTLAARKQFWNKKASIGLTATNPFSKYVNQVTTIVTDNYNSYYRRQIPYRSFGISFSYKFGKIDFHKKEKERDNYMNNVPDMGN
ncbi:MULTISPECIES: TonB-dependent receptor domain-containing protein [Chitinophagaceae]